jgi:hypothetical protein
MNDIERAEHVLNSLRQKRDAVVARGVELGDDRTKLAFAAHATGDAKARKQLDEINREDALRDSELRSLDAAIAEASVRVNRAQQAEARKADQKRAAELRKHVDELAELPAFVDEHLAAALEGLIAFERGVTELNQKGISHPSASQLRLGICAVIQTWAQGLPKHIHNELRDGMSFLAPHERKTATSYFAQVEPGLRTAIKQRLGDAEQMDNGAAA